MLTKHFVSSGITTDAIVFERLGWNMSALWWISLCHGVGRFVLTAQLCSVERDL